MKRIINEKEIYLDDDLDLIIIWYENGGILFIGDEIDELYKVIKELKNLRKNTGAKE